MVNKFEEIGMGLKGFKVPHKCKALLFNTAIKIAKFSEKEMKTSKSCLKETNKKEQTLLNLAFFLCATGIKLNHFLCIWLQIHSFLKT